MLSRSPGVAHSELCALRPKRCEPYHCSHSLLHIRPRSCGNRRVEAVAVCPRTSGRAGRTSSTAATRGGVILPCILGVRLAAVVLVPRSRTSQNERAAPADRSEQDDVERVAASTHVVETREARADDHDPESIPDSAGGAFRRSCGDTEVLYVELGTRADVAAMLVGVEDLRLRLITVSLLLGRRAPQVHKLIVTVTSCISPYLRTTVSYLLMSPACFFRTT